MKRILTMLALVWQCAACTHMNRATLIASTAALACDAGHTYRAASQNWRGGPVGVQYEDNPIMGRNPSTGIVLGYFAVATAVNTAIWFAMPKRYKSIVPLAVVAVQAPTIAGNIESSGNVCGL